MDGSCCWALWHKVLDEDMTPDSVMMLGRQAIEVTVMIAAPLLGVALVVGLLVSIFQAATQINEQTLSFIPKLLGILLTLIFAGPWMLTTMTDYLRQVLLNIPNMVS